MGLYWDNGKEHENYGDYRGYVRVNYRDYIKLYWDNGKENANYRDYRGQGLGFNGKKSGCRQTVI